MSLQDAVLLFCALALALCGALTATSSASALKRALGLALGLSGAALASVALAAPEEMALAMLVGAFAYLVVGAAIAVRVTEAYGDVTVSDLDAADAQSETAEPEA